MSWSLLSLVTSPKIFEFPSKPIWFMLPCCNLSSWPWDWLRTTRTLAQLAFVPCWEHKRLDLWHNSEGYGKLSGSTWAFSDPYMKGSHSFYTIPTLWWDLEFLWGCIFSGIETGRGKYHTVKDICEGAGNISSWIYWVYEFYEFYWIYSIFIYEYIVYSSCHIYYP